MLNKFQSKNILLDKHFEPKIGDFGLANHSQHGSKTVAGTRFSFYLKLHLIISSLINPLGMSLAVNFTNILFYTQLLREHIPKAKETVKSSVFFALLGSALAKAAVKCW